MPVLTREEIALKIGTFEKKIRMLPRKEHAFELMSYEEEDFRPLKRLGYGDMGTVFLATLRETGQAFAMKVMKKEVVKARRNVYRAERELEILSVLDHPFVPRLFAHFESKKNLYLITDFCPGGDMNALRQTQNEQRFSENAARFYAAEVLLAIEYLHTIGVIYRDLKPENVLIQEDGHIMLTDFDLSVKVEIQPMRTRSSSTTTTTTTPGGKASKSPKKIAKKLPFICAYPMDVDVVCATQKAVDVKPSQQRKTKKIFPSEMKSRRGTNNNNSAAAAPVVIKSQSFVGTEEYVAPEMILGSGHGMALDWWTFGIFLYEMLYGTTPFKARNRRDTFYNILSKQPHFPGPGSPAKDLISKLLMKDPSRRLGFVGGAEEIKSHEFFQGVDWESIQLVARPPWVPQPLVVSEFDQELVVDELLKQTVPVSLDPEQNQPEVIDAEAVSDADSRSSSSASSTISDEFSDIEPNRNRGGGGRRRPPSDFSLF